MDIRITRQTPLTNGSTRVEFDCRDDETDVQLILEVVVSVDPQVQGYDLLAEESHRRLADQFRRFHVEILSRLQNWK